MKPQDEKQPSGFWSTFWGMTIRPWRTLGELAHGSTAFRDEVKGAEATPSGWRPGTPTLKVGPDLVGKVWEVWKRDLVY